MSSFSAESNITQVLSGIRRRIGDLQSQYEVVIANNTVYGPAVEFGWEQTWKWANMSKAQRYAILMAMEEKGGPAPERDGVTVTRFEGGWTIKVEPAGMMAKTTPLVAAYGKAELGALKPGFGDSQAKAWLLDKGIFALGHLVNFTPVDHGFLAGQWQEPKLV